MPKFNTTAIISQLTTARFKIAHMYFGSILLLTFSPFVYFLKI